MNIDAQIITPYTSFVKSETAKKHHRILRKSLKHPSVLRASEPVLLKLKQAYA